MDAVGELEALVVHLLYAGHTVVPSTPKFPQRHHWHQVKQDNFRPPHPSPGRPAVVRRPSRL